MATTKVIYEFCVLRVVADVEREEFVNVGLLMMSKRYRWIKAAVHINSKRIEAMWEDVDFARLKTQLALFERKDVPYADLTVEERYRWLCAVKSAIIQTSASHPGLLFLPEDVEPGDIRQALDAKFGELFERLVK